MNTALGQEETWADLGSPVWASRRDVSDGEKAAAGGVFSTVSARFQIRSSTFSRGITAKDMLTCDGREWEIVGIKEIGRRDRIEITATARTDR
ncbi:head-tail adaptor protein [Thioclava kandeliae]